MKAIIYILVLVICFTSCKSVTKMVEKGEYDKAFSYAINKLKGSKHKKREYVIALEKAYDKLNAASLKEIERLQPVQNPEKWSKILAIYESLEDRQQSLDPLLPLVSEDGYEASFELKSYKIEIADAIDNTCEYYYNNATYLIENSEISGDKISARNAYDELKKIAKYKTKFRNIEKLKENALNLGLTQIHIEIINELRDFHGNNVAQLLQNLPFSRLDNLWYDYSTMKPKSNNADFVIYLDLSDIRFSPERETVNNYFESKELLIKKEMVKVEKDTVVAWVEKEVYENVKAQISEVFREKKSELHGKLSVLNNKTKEYIKITPVNVFQDFAGYGCRFVGDERALTVDSKKRMDSYLEQFPTDLDMANNLANAFRDVVVAEVKKQRFE